MPPDEIESRTQSASTEAVVLPQLNLRLKPELSFPFSVVHMYVQPGFLPREREKKKNRRPFWRKIVGLTETSYTRRWVPGAHEVHGLGSDPRVR